MVIKYVFCEAGVFWQWDIHFRKAPPPPVLPLLCCGAFFGVAVSLYSVQIQLGCRCMAC
jgi:hypothetical protein